MKTIIVKCSPISVYTITTIKDGVQENQQIEVFASNLNKAIYSLIEKDSRIYLKGSPKFTERIREGLKEYIATKNESYKDILIELI